MFKFITGKPLWANILFSIGLVIIIFFLFLQSLNLLTRHGDTLTIPAVTGKNYTEAKTLLEAKGFEVQLQDSVYNDTAAALSVLRQFPEADATVKINRTVYLTINRAVAPLTEMPNLEGLSFRSAEIALSQYNLKMGDTSYRSDFAKNSVLEQQYNGQRIKPGTKISMGSTINLVLGSGLGDEFSVPDLYGKTFGEAKILLEANGVSIGSPQAMGDISDTTNAFIIRQSPERVNPGGLINRIRQGQIIDVWLQSQRPEPRPADTLSQSNPGY
ncbi:MAG: PASTA domain-containing protein [Chitinophagaceae bacterium]